MLVVIGSQRRENIEDTEYKVIKWQGDTVILEDENTRQWSLWSKNDDYAGYVVVINAVGYEFVTSYN